MVQAHVSCFARHWTDPRHSKKLHDRTPTTLGIDTMGASSVRCKNTAQPERVLAPESWEAGAILTRAWELPRLLGDAPRGQTEAKACEMAELDALNNPKLVKRGLGAALNHPGTSIVQAGVDRNELPLLPRSPHKLGNCRRSSTWIKRLSADHQNDRGKHDSRSHLRGTMRTGS